MAAPNEKNFAHARELRAVAAVNIEGAA